MDGPLQFLRVKRNLISSANTRMEMMMFTVTGLVGLLMLPKTALLTTLITTLMEKVILSFVKMLFRNDFLYQQNFQNIIKYL